MISIGTFKPDDGGRERRLQLDAAKLVRTRMLVTAASGKGKSYLLRVMLEQLGRSTPIIVLDREGEYVTLGEKLDLVQVGPLGDIPADVRSASMLCRRLMEKRLSAVIDLSELEFDPRDVDAKRRTLIGQQRAYVREFLDQLVSLRKHLWRPTFIVLDEAHLFAPEKGHGDADSAPAVINAATLGRKRAYCMMLATQRIGKLHKDAAAEQLNRFFGGVQLDIDVERCAKDLGMTPKDARAVLRDLKPGEFFAFGPALSEPGIVRMHTAKAQTTHPEAGQGRTLKPPKPSKAIAAVLSEFTDLPQEAEREVKDLASATARIKDLERELKRRPTSTTPAAPRVEPASKADRQTIARLRAGLEQLMRAAQDLKNRPAAFAGLVDAATLRGAIDTAVSTVLKAVAQKTSGEKVKWEKTRREVDKSLEAARRLLAGNGSTIVTTGALPPAKWNPTPPRREIVEDLDDDDDDQDEADDVEPAEGVTKGQQRVLNGLAWWESVGVEATKRTQLGAVAGLNPGSGHLDRVLAPLTSAGLISREGGLTALTADGRKLARVPDATPTLKAYHKKLRSVIKGESSRKAFDVFAAGGPRDDWTREEIGETVGLNAGSGHLDRVLAPLTSLGVIARKARKTATTSLLFPDELKS